MRRVCGSWWEEYRRMGEASDAIDAVEPIDAARASGFSLHESACKVPSHVWTMARGQMIRGRGFFPSHVIRGMQGVEHHPVIEALYGERLRRRGMDLKLKDKVARITGSSRGIGRATATAFAAEGCRLVLSARSAAPLAAAEAALRADGVAVVSCLVDVA